MFAVYTLHAARHPGLIASGTIVPYPWAAVLATWTVLAVLVGVLGAILRPTFRQSWGRIAGAFAYAMILMALNYITFTTDIPGYFYVPGVFAMSTLAGVVVLSVAAVVGRLVDGRRASAT